MRFLIAIVIVGGMLVFWGVQEVMLRSAASDEPQTITCQQLAEAGPGENAHVTMENFILCDFAYVYEEKDNRWQKVWVPAVPLGGEYHQKLASMIDEQGNLVGNMPMPRNVNVIVKSNKVMSEADLSTLANQETIQGLIVNQIESLGSEEKKILKDSYPSVDFNKCWILEVGRAPASMGKMAGLLGGGLGMIGVAGIFLLRSFMSETPKEGEDEFVAAPGQFAPAPGQFAADPVKDSQSTGD